MERADDAVTLRYGTDGGAPTTLLRPAYFPPDAVAQAGPMCASPTGKGFTTRFTGLEFTES